MSAITITTRPDGVAVLTFDQVGSKANVLTRELWTEFGEALATVTSAVAVGNVGGAKTAATTSMRPT